MKTLKYLIVGLLITPLLMVESISAGGADTTSASSVKTIESSHCRLWAIYYRSEETVNLLKTKGWRIYANYSGIVFSLDDELQVYGNSIRRSQFIFSPAIENFAGKWYASDEDDLTEVIAPIKDPKSKDEIRSYIQSMKEREKYHKSPAPFDYPIIRKTEIAAELAYAQAFPSCSKVGGSQEVIEDIDDESY